jgi:hypothetical protein
MACGTIDELAAKSGVEKDRTNILDEIYHRYFERREA